MPIGRSTIDDINTPISGETAPSLASFFPEMSITQYNTKNITEMIAELPRPPFFRMAPSGAPMKKKMKQAMARANLLKISMPMHLRVKV